MSISITSYPVDPFTPPQSSNSLPGKVIAQVYRAASYVISSINRISQSILSKCIYIGSIGRYTLDDVKSYLFTDQAALQEEVLKETTAEEEPEYISKLKRQDSKISVNSTFFRSLQESGKKTNLYPDLSAMAKLSERSKPNIEIPETLEKLSEATSKAERHPSMTSLSNIEEE